jgi:hypothetical protein
LEIHRMQFCDIPSNKRTLHIVPWSDPVVDQIGYDPRTLYVEQFWLGILGPSATWLLRYLVNRLDTEPAGFDLDLLECALSLGLGRRPGATAAFPRTISRCCQFGAVRFCGPTKLAVRRMLPPLSRRQIARLPRRLQDDHAAWVDQAPTSIAQALQDRARQLALSLIELGEDGPGTERQLNRWRFHPAMASEATTWALGRRQAARSASRGSTA